MPVHGPAASGTLLTEMKLRTVLFTLIILGVLSAKGANFTDSIRQAYYLEQARNKKIDPRRRIAYYDSILTGKNYGNNDLRLYIEKGIIYEDMGQYEKARESYMKIKGRIPKDSLALQLKYDIRYAAIQYYLDSYEESIKSAYKIILTRKPDTLLYFDVEANRLLSHIFDYPGERFSMFLERARKKNDVFQKTDAPQYLKDFTAGGLHFSNSSAALRDKDYHRAFKEGALAQKILGKYEDEANSAFNTALIYHQMNQLDMAEKYYKEIIALDDYHPDRLMAVVNYCHLLLSRGDKAGAKNLLESQERTLSKLEGTPWEEDLYYVRYAVAEANGDVPEALGWLKKGYQMVDSLNRHRKSLYLQNLAEKYEGTDRESVNHALSIKVSRLTVLSISLGVALLAAVILAIFLLRGKRRREEEVRGMARAIERYERRNQRQSQKAEESIGERSRQLSSMTMHMRRLNEELCSIERTIADSSLSKEDMVSEIKKALRVLEGQENVWEMFKVYFEEVNQRFFDNLFKACPDLTKAEVRMCAYMLTGMTTKEIASVTNRSVRTVDCIKYNIRRKLNISGPTETFIRRLSAEGLRDDADETDHD